MKRNRIKQKRKKLALTLKVIHQVRVKKSTMYQVDNFMTRLMQNKLFVLKERQSLLAIENLKGNIIERGAIAPFFVHAKVEESSIIAIT